MSGIFFNGRLLVTPTTESAIYDGELASVSNPRTPNTLAILGTSEGGVPKEVMHFNSPLEARRALRGGELLKAVEYAFAPSAETGSPSTIAVVRVEDAQPATLTLKAGSADVINVTSADYGAHTNSIKVTIENGAVTGKNVIVQQGDAYYTRNNLTAVPLSVRYSGTEATATVAVTGSAVELAAPAGTVVATLTLDSYRNVRELCDAINAIAGFSALALLPTHTVNGTLDGLAATACKGVDAPIKADLQAIIDWLNVGARDLVRAARVSGALSAPDNLVGTYLSGGNNGSATTTSDWQDGFDALQSADVQWVVPLSANPDVWDMANSHCTFMSGPGQSERRAFVGGGVIEGSLADAIDVATAQAAALNSDRVSLVFPSILDYDDSGFLAPMPAYFLAAKIAGGFGAVGFGNSMTNKTVSVHGLEPLLVNAYDTDSLISSGVLCVRKNKRGYVVAKAVTTWLSSDNYNRVEISTGAALDFVARSIREALAQFLGRKASRITLDEAMSVTDSVLRELARPEPIGNGVIVGDAASPAYRNINAEIKGDVLRVWFECSPVIPINYVLVGIHAKAYTGTATTVAA